MKKQTLKEWLDEGTEKFGESHSDWEFVCPKCGRVNKASEFLTFSENESHAINKAYSECIGRYDKTRGCDWASYGLFGTLSKGRQIVTEDGKITEVFDFSNGTTQEESNE